MCILCLLDRVSSWQWNKDRPTWCHLLYYFIAQHVSNVSTSILRSLRLICLVISCVVLLWFDVCWCYGVVRLGVVWYPYAGWSQHTSNQSNTTHEKTQQISRKLLSMDVLTFETCWALNIEIIKQATSSWSIFIQPHMCNYHYVQYTFL